MNNVFTFFALFFLSASFAAAYELDENLQNTPTSAIEILSAAFSEIQSVEVKSPATAVQVENAKGSEASPKTVQSVQEEKEAPKIESKTTVNFDPKEELGAITPNVGEVVSPEENSSDNISSSTGLSDSTDNTYIKNVSNAESLINKINNIAKGPSNQLLNQVGLTPNLAKNMGVQIPETPKQKNEDSLFSDTSSKSSFGVNSSDKTSSFNSISKPSGQSASEQLQETLNDLKKKEEEKKLSEKKDQLGKDIKKFSELKTPITKDDYNEIKKLFQDKDNISLLNEMNELDPNFLTNANESYYGKEGEGDHGVRDNDKLGKLPLLNFIDQFKEQLATNPEIFKQRNLSNDPNKFLPHDRERNEESH